MRQLAAVLLRRSFFSHFEEIMKQLDDGTKAQMKSQVLLLINKNISTLLRKKVCDFASELARNFIGNFNY